MVIEFTRVIILENTVSIFISKVPQFTHSNCPFVYSQYGRCGWESMRLTPLTVLLRSCREQTQNVVNAKCTFACLQPFMMRIIMKIFIPLCQSNGAGCLVWFSVDWYYLLVWSLVHHWIEEIKKGYNNQHVTFNSIQINGASLHVLENFSKLKIHHEVVVAANNTPPPNYYFRQLILRYNITV